MEKHFKKLIKSVSNSSKSSTSKSTGGKGTNKNAYFAEQAEKSAKKLPSIAKLIIAFFFIIGAAASFFVLQFVCKDDCFEINGRKAFSLSINGTYADEGVKIIAFGKDISDQAKITIYKNGEEISGFDQIDTTEEGVYQIVYTTDSFRFKDVKLIRTITVVSDETEDYENEEDSYTPEETTSTSFIFPNFLNPLYV